MTPKERADLRRELAAMFLQGIISVGGLNPPAQAVSTAFTYADAFIAYLDANP